MKTLRPKEREADILKTIMDGLAAMHAFAFRINTAAFTGEHKGKKRFFRSHSMGPGCADILVLSRSMYPTSWKTGSPKGWLSAALWIEVKRPGEKQTPEQIAFQDEVEAEGHRYIVARSWEDVWQAVK